MKRCHVHLTGQVQGRGLRASCRLKAWWLGLGGWVRNESDGTVSLEIEGSDDKISRFIEWLKAGPGTVRADKVEINDIPATGSENFAIIYKK